MENEYKIDPDRISDLMVMKSRAGWYLGHAYYYFTSDGKKIPHPYSRKSGYYNTEKEARKELELRQQIFGNK